MADRPVSVKDVRRDSGTTVVVLTGEVDLHHVPEVHAVILRECAEKPARLVIDLAEVTYMDSSGVGVLVHAYQKMNALQGKLRLVGMQPRVRSVFEITRLDRYFTICSTLEEAMAT